MVCRYCGMENAPGAVFCGNCGNVIETIAPPQAQVEIKDPGLPGKGMGIASMILGIVSLIMTVGCCTYATVPALICSILAMVFGGKAKKEAKSVGKTNGMATAGKTLGIISLIFIIITIALIVIYYLLYGSVLGLAMLAESGAFG